MDQKERETGGKLEVSYIAPSLTPSVTNGSG